MKRVSIIIEESTLKETNKICSYINQFRNKYINEAIAYYNKLQRRRVLEQKLKKESALVRENSLKVLREFEVLPYQNA